MVEELSEKEDGEYIYKTIPKGEGVSGKSVKLIIDALVARHSLISEKHFFKEEWARLQNIDSLMAKQVVKAFLVKGETCLPYHDSFVCAARLKGFLIDTMKEAWEIVLGDAKGFDYDIEFDNTPITDVSTPKVDVTPIHINQYEGFFRDYATSNNLDKLQRDNLDKLQRDNTEAPQQGSDDVVGHLSTIVPLEAYEDCEAYSVYESDTPIQGIDLSEWLDYAEHEDICPF